MNMQSMPANLLVIMSDEHRKDAMGCVGHPIVTTPNLDALCARGTLFSNAYSPSPMCVPARASMACGDYVHKLGYWDSATPYDGRVRSWMRRLRASGVTVTSIGKLHFRSSEDDNGFTEEILPMHVVNEVGWPIGLLRDELPEYSGAEELARDVGVGTSSYTDYDLAITDAAKQWLGSIGESCEPWATFVSLVSPHYPLRCPEEYYQLYDPAQMDMPVGYGKQMNPGHSELQNVARFFNYADYFDERKIREAKSAYYGLTSFMDNCVGEILQVLDKTGQGRNTVVIYMSDHGDMMGDQGFWTKQVMYEQSVGVPMIAAGPGFPSGRKVITGTSLVDLATTAIDVLGVAPDSCDQNLPGKSLRTLANSDDDLERTILSEYHDGGSTTGTFMIRWQNWKYIHYVDHAPQLFNLVADPDETRDLALEAANSARLSMVLQEGRDRLQKICDPDDVNNRCFADQRRRIDELGGRDACLSGYVFNHTPAPTAAVRQPGEE